MIALLFLWLAASSPLELVNEVYQIPAGEWRYVELGLSQQPAAVNASFEAVSGPHQVRVALMRREDLEHLRQGFAHGVMAVTPPAGEGHLRHQVMVPGEYVLVVDNLGAKPASVHLHVAVDFAARTGPAVTRLPLRQQLTVVLISFAVFFGIVSWSTKRLLREVRR